MSDESRKLYYSIGEVADLFNLNESNLRYWEKEFPKLLKPKKNAKGTRSYTKEDIENIRLIYFLLKEKGMTIEGARKSLREEKKGMTAQLELAERLKRLKTELLKLQDELGRPKTEIDEPKEEPIATVMYFPSKEQEVVADVIPKENVENPTRDIWSGELF